MAEDEPLPDDDENGNGDDAEGGDGNGGKKGGKPAKRSKLPLIIGGVVVLLLVAGGAGWVSGLLPHLLGIPVEQKEARIDLGEPTTYELPVIKADLKTGACRAPFLRTQIVVQLLPKDLPRLQEMQTRVVDQIVAYLREVERQELVGKDGTERLRFDIVRIINREIAPASVQTVLFKELLLQ